MMNQKTRSLTHAALIAAVYFLLTIVFQAISFGPVQFRISEALMLLPLLTADAVPGLFVGCLIANLLGGGVWYDVVLGSFATLLAAWAARKFRRYPLIAAFMPALFNGLIIGPVVYFAYVRAPGDMLNWSILFSSAFTVMLGEITVCYALGLPLAKLLRRLPAETLDSRMRRKK